MGFLSGIPVIGDIVDFASKNFFANKANNAQWELQQAQIDAQKELQTSQNAWNEQMWNKNNEYNSPANQMKLYRDAGLNPAFFMGQGNSVSGSPAASSSISAPSVPQPADNYSGVGSALGNMGSDFLNAMLTESVINKNNKEAGLTDTEIEFNQKTMGFRVKQQELLNGLTTDQRNELQERVNKLKADTHAVRIQSMLTDAQKEQQEILNAFLPAAKMLELKQLDSVIKSNLSNAAYNTAQVMYSKQMLGLVAAQIETERHKQANLDASSGVYNSQEKLNNATVGLVGAETENQKISNEVRDATKETEKLGQNISNITTPIVDVYNSIVSSIGTAISGKAQLKNAATNKERNSIKANQRVVKHNYRISVGR